MCDMQKPNFFSNLSIKSKLLLSYLLVIMLCTVLLCSVIYSQFQSIMRTQLADHVDHVITLTAKNLEQQVKYVDTLLFNIQMNQKITSTITSRDIDVLNSIDILSEQLDKTDILQKRISDVKLYLIDKPDYPSIYSDSIIVSDSFVKSDVWYINTINGTGETYWSIYHSNGTDGYVQASRLIYDFRTKEPAAVAAIRINLISFLNNINEIQLNNTGDIMLVSDRQPVYMYDKPHLNSIKNTPSLLNFLSDDSKRTALEVYDGQRYILGQSGIDGTDFSIVGIFNLSMLNISSGVMGMIIILTSIVCILLSLALMAVLSRSITTPIYNLCSIMKHFEKDVSFRCDVPYNNEIGELYKSFNTMMSTVDNLVTDINDLFERQKTWELKALQAQINPHFLYNTLDSVNWMAQQHGYEDISSIVTALGSFFRYSLNKGQEFTTLENELYQIRSYIEIQKIRFKDKLNTEFDIDESILPCRIAKLTLQPLVENCIVHGFDNFEYMGVITITGTKKDGYVYLTVSDNGKGGDVDKMNRLLDKEFSPDEPIEKYGIHNVNQRIKLYFGNECGLHYEENEIGGIDVTATLKERYFE